MPPFRTCKTAGDMMGRFCRTSRILPLSPSLSLISSCALLLQHHSFHPGHTLPKTSSSTPSIAIQILPPPIHVARPTKKRKHPFRDSSKPKHVLQRVFSIRVLIIVAVVLLVVAGMLPNWSARSLLDYCLTPRLQNGIICHIMTLNLINITWRKALEKHYYCIVTTKQLT